MLLGCSIPAKTFMPEYKGDNSQASEIASLLDKCRYANKIGYDYVELSVGAVNELDETELSLMKKSLDNGEFKLFCCNSFVPPDIKLCTEDYSVISTFVRKTMERLASIKVTEIVFGSGYARKRPDTVSENEARNRLCDFLLLCADEGNKYGITTCIEPLNSTETNMINTTTDAANYVREINRSNIKLLPDLFHMCMENENPEVLIQLSDITAHLHASEAPGRVFPGKFGGEYLKRAACILKKGFLPSVTVECVFDDYATESKIAYDFMRGNYE